MKISEPTSFLIFTDVRKFALEWFEYKKGESDETTSFKFLLPTGANPLSSLASLKLPCCCSSKQGRQQKRLNAYLAGLQGRTRCAQDISPGYLTYLGGIFITVYSHPSNSTSPLTSLAVLSRFWVLVHTDVNYMKVQPDFYLQHLYVPKKSIQKPLWADIKLLQLVLNRIPVIHVFTKQVSCHNPYHYRYCTMTPMPCQLLHFKKGYLWRWLSRTITYSNLLFTVVPSSLKGITSCWAMVLLSSLLLATILDFFLFVFF